MAMKNGTVTKKVKLDFDGASATYGRIKESATDLDIYNTARAIGEMYNSELVRQGIVLTVETELLESN